MRVDVTPLGAASRSIAAVARAVVDYLGGAPGDPGAGLFGGGGVGGAAAYYGDSPEGPGRWVGAGAAFQRLTGTVDRDAFTRILEGRHPETGARLITARGSSQRAHLAVGAAARYDALGQPLYDVADAAALLNLTYTDAADMIGAADGGPVDDGDRGALRTVNVDGVAYVPDSEISRHLELATDPPTAAQVLAGGAPGDLLTVPQAAAALGVSPRYVRRLCGRAETRDVESRAARLPATQDRRGHYWIRRMDLADFAACRKPPVARVGYDLTLTVEKSFGIVMMLAPAHIGHRFVDALDVANTTALRHLDRHAAVARRRGQVVGSEGLVGASYFHATSRALDPHPHRHNVIANAVVDDDGGIRALDARALYREGPTAAALATAAARWELRDLGLGWWRRDDGIWEIAGVDDTAIDEFSSRHRDIAEIKDSLARRLGRPVSIAEDHKIWADTRADKTAVDPIALQRSWRDRADRVGLDISRCWDRPDRAIAFDTLEPERVDTLFADLTDRDGGLCGSVDRFTRGDVIAAIADWSLVDLNGQRRKVLLPVAEIEALADRFLASDLAIPLDPTLARGALRRGDGQLVDDGHPDRRYSTREILTVQQRVLDAWHHGRDARSGVVDDATLDATLAAHRALTDEQVALVRSWCTSGHRAQGAIGRAGTGKTTTMRAAAAAWRAAGYRVIGAAVKGEAARKLAVDAGIDADTVALLLAEARRRPHVLDTRTILIVDEASTLGDRDLDALLRLVEASGATMRTIGDPAQHQSVPTGGCWSYLVTHTPTVELTTVHRLVDAGERRRADQVRDSHIRRALDDLVASGQLELSDSDGDTYAKMLTRWLDARNSGQTHPMVHGRNRERRLLNRIAQQLLVDTGTVDPTQSITTRHGTRLCLGDDVIARHGDRRIHPDGEPDAWLRNGTSGTITAVEHGDTPTDDRIEITTDDGDIFRCARAVFDRARGGVDLRYAVTSYAVQGETRDVSTSALTASTSRAELYVDITRGRQSNKLYATRTVASHDDDRDRWLPALERHLIDDLANRMSAGSGAPAAAADPVAARLAQAGPRRTLAALLAARRAGRHVDDAEIERVTAAVRAGASRPERLRDVVVGPVPPHLERRIDRLVGDLAEHHATHNPPRRHAVSLIEHILGPRPASIEARDSWDRIAEDLTDITCDSHIAATSRRDPSAAGAAAAHRDDLARYVRVALGGATPPDPGIAAAIITAQAPPAIRRRRQELEIA